MKNKITVIGLKQNGEPFNPTTFSINDNLDAIFINSGDVANTRVVAYGSDTVLQSNIKTTSVGFKQFIEEFDEGEYGCPRNFLISKYQEYMYPFFLSEDTARNKNDGKFIDIHKLLDWCSHNLNTDERVEILLTSFDLWLSKVIIAKSEDVGVIVDYYDEEHDEPVSSDTYFFEDYEQEPIEKIYPTACGVNFENRPTLTFTNSKNNLPFTLWYHTTFLKIDASLEFIRELFKNGILVEDIGITSKGALWLSMDELSEVN